jgi:hypothetical protein
MLTSPQAAARDGVVGVGVVQNSNLLPFKKSPVTESVVVAAMQLLLAASAPAPLTMARG